MNRVSMEENVASVILPNWYAGLGRKKKRQSVRLCNLPDATEQVRGLSFFPNNHGGFNEVNWFRHNQGMLYNMRTTLQQQNNVTNAQSALIV